MTGEVKNGKVIGMVVALLVLLLGFIFYVQPR